jgi:hypothetical protein
MLGPQGLHSLVSPRADAECHAGPRAATGKILSVPIVYACRHAGMHKSFHAFTLARLHAPMHVCRPAFIHA